MWYLEKERIYIIERSRTAYCLTFIEFLCNFQVLIVLLGSISQALRYWNINILFSGLFFSLLFYLIGFVCWQFSFKLAKRKNFNYKNKKNGLKNCQ
jgi:hypothetical protein